MLLMCVVLCVCACAHKFVFAHCNDIIICICGQVCMVRVCVW